MGEKMTTEIFRIGGARLVDGDEGQTEEEVSIRLSDGFQRVRLASRCIQYGRSDTGLRTGAVTEQLRMSFKVEHLPMVIAALQTIQADQERRANKTT